MKYKQFSIEEREKIQELVWEKISIRGIAKILKRSHSSIIRELNRSNKGRAYQYKPRLAHERALNKRKCRGRKERLKNENIRLYVIEHLHLRWSPEQIAGRIRIDLEENISHEAIYQFIYNQVRNGSNLIKPEYEDLRLCLRRRRKIRLPHGAKKCQRIFKSNGISIDDRPSIVNERRRIDDWEGDTVESCNHKPGINTLVERKTSLVFITKLKNKTGNATSEIIAKRFNNIPKKLKQTITLDNGPENRDRQNIEKLTEVKCYYAHPYCSGDRGTNKNTNGLIIKRYDMSSINSTQDQGNDLVGKCH
jgi:IS30 family transposase